MSEGGYPLLFLGRVDNAADESAMLEAEARAGIK